MVLINIGIATTISHKIQDMLKKYNPNLWIVFGGGQSMFKNSIQNSLASRKIVYNPPSEITHKPLLRLFLIMRILDAISGVMIVGIFFSNMAFNH